jgi:hypothetical protein
MLHSRSASGPTAPESPRRAVRMAVLAACAACLAGCGGSDDVGDIYCPGVYCVPCTSNCGPYEVSYGLVAGNFAGNGFTSLVQTSAVINGYGPYPGSLKASLGTGVGSFAAPVLTADGDNPLYLAGADLNGDHLPDVVSASFDDGSLSVFFNDATSPGSFSAPHVLASPGASQVAIADMNGDGLPDLISADFNVSLFLQSAPGAFASPIPLYPGGANWVAAGDLNNDGAADVALVDNYGVWVLLHTGASAATTYAAPLAVYAEAGNPWYVGANIVAIADVNGDGLKDLIVTDPGPVGGGMPTVAVLVQDPASPGTFLAPVSYATAPGSLAQSISVVDVNGDGHPDILSGGTNAVSVLLQNPAAAGTFMAAANYSVTDANEIAVVDVNGDGLLDVVVATGLTQQAVNGVVPNLAGVLLQSATAPGTFGALQNLP